MPNDFHLCLNYIRFVRPALFITNISTSMFHFHSFLRKNLGRDAREYPKTQAPLNRRQVMPQRWNSCLADCSSLDASSACSPANLGRSETRAWPKWCYISQGETYVTARVAGRSQRRLEQSQRLKRRCKSWHLLFPWANTAVQ